MITSPNLNFLAQIEEYPEMTPILENKYQGFIKKEGIYEPWGKDITEKYLPHKSLKYLIENNLVTQDKNGDWILIEYSAGVSNSPDWLHWLETGCKRNWSIYKWKQDTDINEKFTFYSMETKDGWNRTYLSVKLNNHLYSRITNPNGFWVETVERTDICDGSGKEQLYYKDNFGSIQGKMPVKIEKKIQELKNKNIKFGYYKF